MLRKRPEYKHYSSSSHSHQEAQKNWDMQDTRQSVGQSNSVASKWASTGLQKCFKHSLYPEKESVWKTAEDRNESVMW